MSVKMITRKREPRQVSIKLSDGSMLRGQVNLHHEEMLLNRVSELFTRDQDPFVVLFGVTVEGTTNRVLVVNKRHIIWIAPEPEEE